MGRVVEKSLRKDLFEGNGDEELRAAYETLNGLTEEEKYNLIISLMFNKIQGERV